jgi:hypothetical protein
LQNWGNVSIFLLFQSLPMIIYVLACPKTAYFCSSQNRIRNVSPDWINFWCAETYPIYVSKM